MDKSAFPLVATFAEVHGDVVEITRGLTRRELFAAMAMQGYLVSDEAYGPQFQGQPEGVAWRAVQYADALCAELDGTAPMPEKDDAD